MPRHLMPTDPAAADDAAALRDFARTRAPEAFGAVAARHVNLVYHACLRQLRSADAAALATRATFILLARGAADVDDGPAGPLLYDTARQVCRRMSPAASPDDAAAAAPSLNVARNDWAKLAPLFDDAMAALPQGARHAVLLKYVAGLPLQSVAAALGVDAATAGQKISAGVTRLRQYLDARNVPLAADALVAAVQVHAAKAAPPGLARDAAAGAMTAAASAADGHAPAVALADRVRQAERRARRVTLAAMLLAALILSAGVLKLGLAVRDARQTAATQPLTSGGGATATIGPAGANRPAVPAAQPEKPLDPEQAARLIDAVRRGDLGAIERLVDEEPALVNAKDAKTNRSAIDIAADQVRWRRGDSTRIAHLLIDAGALTSLHSAARAGHRALVEQMLDVAPGRIDAREAGLTPLQRAALIPGTSPECEEVADLLIRRGATVDLWTASTFGLLEDVRRNLAEHPDQINQPCQGATPLNWAARPRRYAADPIALPALLIDKGADVASRDTAEDGMTPLHHAAEWGGQQGPLIELLLAKGADVNALDDYGWTPLDYAADRGHADAVALLQAKGGRRTTIDHETRSPKTARFFAAARAGDADQVHLLLDDTPELATARGPTGETPLHSAAAAGSIPSIDWLLADRADPNAAETNKYGGTPLHWAVRHDRLEAAKHLLSKGADPKALNTRNGQTLLHVLAQHTDDPALADLLLTLGIDRAAKDRFGRTALDYAEQAGHPTVATRLRAAGN